MHSGKFCRFCVGSFCPQTPPFLKPTTQPQAEVSPLVVMPAADRGCLQQQSRSVGASCAAASVWQQNTARLGGNSLGQAGIIFKGNAGVGRRELGICFLLPPLLLIFIWSLAKHLPSVFARCKNT